MQIARGEPTLRTHQGYEWLYVLSGRLRLLLAEDEFLLGSGEAVEFSTCCLLEPAPVEREPSDGA